MRKKIIIVGGVAGGATAAARLRRLDEQAEIIMIERGPHISFANCGLPYYVGGTIKEKAKLLVQTVQGMTARFNLDIRVNHEVIGIDRESKKIEVKDWENGKSYEESYDTLILSPGAAPIVPDMEGVAENPKVFTLRTVPDAESIVNYINTNQPKTAVIVGGGFIGLEMAENLKERNLEVVLVEATNQVQPALDYEMACLLHTHLKEKGVRLILEDSVTRVHDANVTLRSGRTIKADMVILCIGVRPENALALQAGLELGVKGAIRVNEYLQTSDENIYAIGDAIEVKNYINGTPVHIPLAWPANRQGRLVADNICGAKKVYSGTLGTSVAKVFDLTAASTGINEKLAKQQGLTYRVIHIHPNSHAGYYPGAMPLDMKMVFQEDGRILGAQAVGYKGVEKRIDVIATAIKGGLTVYDLQDLELAYAPPYSSGKDPVNLLGYAASNILEKLVETVQYDEIDPIVKAGGLLIDVSQPEELALGKIEGSINIPLPELRKRLSELPKDQTIYITCRMGLRGYIAARILAQHGYKAVNLDGGYRTYASVYGNPNKKEAVLKQPVDDGGKAISEGVDDSPLTGTINPDRKVDATCMQCPGPIKLIYENMNLLQNGQILEVSVTDPGFARDIKAWCAATGNTLLKTEKDGESLKAYLRKGRTTGIVTERQDHSGPDQNSQDHNGWDHKSQAGKPKGATLVVFEQDMDKALASFIIATGAASMGKPVTMFFTFWGLNILRRENPPAVKKDLLEKAFGLMMPRGPKKLPISNMNMGGMGSVMIRKVMAKKKVDSLETLIKNAMAMGVKVVACSMSMDVMGIKQEELIDGVEIGGVASYLGETEEANLNLFI